MSDKPLAGRMAVVTGASSGLGARFARVLSEAGASVAVMARRTDRLEALVAELNAASGKAAAFALDVADTAAIGPALDQAEAALGPLSIMVNNAGVGGDGMAMDMTVETFDQTMAVNVRAVYFGAVEAAKRMIASGVAEAGEARIINIASIAAFNQLPGLTVYCASKAACASLTKGLAREWARPRIAVNAICPGYIETEINSDWFQEEGGKKQMATFPRKRLMEESDLDGIIEYLCADASRGTTGSVFTVDDGQSL